MPRTFISFIHVRERASRSAANRRPTSATWFESCRNQPARRGETGSGGKSQAIPLPEAEPRVLCIHLVMLSVRSGAVLPVEWPRIRECIDAFQPLYFVNCLLDIHAV